MEISRTEVTPHPLLLEVLFAHRRKVSSVFRDVLGLHEINHIAIAQVDMQQQLLILSSTPAMEFNLFSTPLWRFDQTYSPEWYKQYQSAYWQSLYAPERYDELYYLKQIKPQYAFGISLAQKRQQEHYIFSFASHRSCIQTQTLFSEQQDDFYKIGLYCTHLLRPLFNLIRQQSAPSSTRTEQP